MKRKVAGWSALIFLVFYIVNRPHDAARAFDGAWHFTHVLASGIADFLSQL